MRVEHTEVLHSDSESKKKLVELIIDDIYQQRLLLVSQMTENCNPASFDVDRYTQLRRERVNLEKALIEMHEKWDSLGGSLDSLDEDERTAFINGPMTLDDHSLKNLWRVSMMIGFEFRKYFGVARMRQVGFFVEKQLNQIVHSYSYWNDYPSDDHILEEAHSEGINALVVSDDGRYLFSGSRDKCIKVWDLNKDALIHKWQAHSYYVTSLDYRSPFLVSGGGSRDITIRVWNAYTFELVHTMEGHSDTVTVVKLNERGTRIVSGSADRTVRIWSVKSGECEKIFREHIDTVRALQWRAQIVISGAKDATVKVWDPHTLRVSREIVDEACPPGTGKKKGWVTELCLNCDSSLMFCNRRKISAMIYAWPSFEVRQILGFPSFCGCFHPWIPHLLALCDRNDESIKLVDTRDGRCIRSCLGHTRGTRDIRFTPNGHRLISTGLDQNIRIWDISTLE